MNLKQFILMFSIVLLSACKPMTQEQTFRVELTVPDTTWQIAITDLYEVNGEAWVIAKLSQPAGVASGNLVGAMVISKVIDQISARASGKAKYIVIGKTWNWESEEPYTFVDSMDSMQSQLKSAKRIQFSR